MCSIAEHFSFTVRLRYRPIACMMRKCLRCDRVFASLDSGERHCRVCQKDSRSLLSEERRSYFIQFLVIPPGCVGYRIYFFRCSWPAGISSILGLYRISFRLMNFPKILYICAATRSCRTTRRKRFSTKMPSSYLGYEE